MLLERRINQGLRALCRTLMQSSSKDGGFFPDKEEGAKDARDEESVALPLFLNKRCRYCAQMPVEDEIEDAFGILVCRQCRYSSLEFVTKTTCTSRYLLGDDDLKGLRFLERPNPRKGTWSRMHLYLREQAEEAAVAKWGSLERIDEARARRKKMVEDRKVRKLKERIRDLRKKTRMAVGSSEQHVHEFVVEGGVSRCSCGIVVEQEEL